MCALKTAKEVLFNAEEIESLTVPVVDIYGTRAWCIGQCLGAADTDGIVPIDSQRLFLTAENYEEIDGGAVCHLDFIIDVRNAAEELVKIVLARRGSPVASR